MDATDRAHAYMARASIAYATACIAPDRRKRTGYGWNEENPLISASRRMLQPETVNQGVVGSSPTSGAIFSST